MALSLATKLGLATSFLLSTSVSGEAALPKTIPSTYALSALPLNNVATLDIKNPRGLAQACSDPTLAVEEQGFVYIRDESGIGAYKMRLIDFTANYNHETQTISFPSDTPRVLCPI